MAPHLEKFLEIVKGRSLTFVMTYSLFLAALAIVVASVEWFNTPCQERANAVAFILPVDPSLTNHSILDACIAALRTRNLELGIKKNVSSITTVQVFDWNGELQSLSYRFVQIANVDDGTSTWALRYAAKQLCADSPPYSLTVAYNADYESAAQNVYSVFQRDLPLQYVTEGTLRTSSEDRFATFQHLQSVFPSFRHLPFKGHLQRTGSWLVARSPPMPILLNEEAMIGTLQLQRWYTAIGEPVAWKISLVSSDSYKHNAAKKAFLAISNEMTRRHGNCSSCLDTFGQLFQ